MRFLSGCAILCIGLATIVNANTIIEYGDFEGDHIWFRQVEETIIGDDPTPLFDTPTADANGHVAGDTLLFTPPLFLSESSGGAFVPAVISTLETTIEAKAGSAIDELNLHEAGDVTLMGVGGANTFAVVSAAVFIYITEVDYVPIDAINYNANMVFTEGGNWNLADDGMLFSHIWEGSLDIDIGDLVVGAGYPGMATEVILSFGNQLVTMSEDGTQAHIQKKQIDGIGVDVIWIPEPASALLLAFGMAVVARRRRG